MIVWAYKMFHNDRQKFEKEKFYELKYLENQNYQFFGVC